MSSRASRTILLALSFPVAILLAGTRGHALGQDASQPAESAYVKSLPDGPGKAVMVRMCGSCHEVDEVATRHLSKQGWSQKVDEMFQEGMVGTDEDTALVVDYLFQILPARLDINKATSKDFSVFLGLSEADGNAVVAYRKKSGPFKKWQDLELVPGVNFKKIQERSEILVID